MKKTFFLFLLVALAVSSCATTRYYAGFTPETAGQDLVLMGPASDIFYLDKNNNDSLSDTLSTVSETLIAGLVEELGVSVSGRIELDADEKEEATAFMRYLVRQDANKRGDFAIPFRLDEALEAQGCRYGLLLYAQGMTRDAKGYAKDVAKSAFLAVATTILTLGAVTMYTTADAYSSQIFAAVLDAETNHVTFFNCTPIQERNPLRPDPVRKQLRSVIKDFLK